MSIYAKAVHRLLSLLRKEELRSILTETVMLCSTTENVMKYLQTDKMLR